MMTRFNLSTLPTDVLPLTDDHHLVVLADADDEAQHDLGQAIQLHLDSIENTEAVLIDGRQVTSIAGLLRRLKRRSPVEPAEPSICGLLEILRRWPGSPQRRYFIWPNADLFLEADILAFSRVVNAFCAAAAEDEHLNPRPLVIQRVIYIGGAKLGAYAEDERGQFNRWLDDAPESDEAGLWQVYACLDHPPVLTYRLCDEAGERTGG